MRNTSKKLLAALVITGVLSISGAAFASHREDISRSPLVGDIMRLVIDNARPAPHHHHHRAQTPPPPPPTEFKKGHRPPPPDGKFPPMSHDKRFDDGRRMPPPPKGDKRPPEPPREPKGFKPHIKPHHPMAKR